MPAPTKVVIDCATGAAVQVSLTDAEIAQTAIDAQVAADAATADAARQQRIVGARPAAALLVKLRDGGALTAPELQTVVRFLALQAIREAQG